MAQVAAACHGCRFIMHYPSLAALIADRQSVFAKGPICLILIEDEIAVAATLRHHAAAGFGTLVAFC
ncbi:MAG: hypothetical protein IIX61_08895, partial [Loktanella sp.]|nr:hypothetical protein [Loktanella sp.]